MRRVTNVLRNLRQDYKKTQDYMAARLGISQSQYNKIEQGDKPLDIITLLSIAKIFHIEPIQLFQNICAEQNGISPAKPADKQDHTAGEVTGEYYRKMARHFEDKFLETYRLYIEATSKK
jgi:transcriptional regulator with XRE-family HTH domain